VHSIDFAATYSDGKAMRRQTFSAETRLAAYEAALKQAPAGFSLSHLRKLKTPRRNV
jgi:hypothetical protein